MKSIIVLISLFVSYASADQCQYVTKDQAERAKLLITDGTVLKYCEPCGESRESLRPIRVRSTEIKVIEGEEGYRELQMNNQYVDLAYLFVKVSDDRYVNVSKVVGCESRSVSAAIRLP